MPTMRLRMMMNMMMINDDNVVRVAMTDVNMIKTMMLRMIMTILVRRPATASFVNCCGAKSLRMLG